MKFRHSIHYAILILAFAGGAAVIGLLFLHFRQVPQAPAIAVDRTYSKTLMAGSLAIPVSIADTPAARDQGLSDTETLPATAGKLFVFEQPGKPGFWMKDMRYGLDFVWIDSSLKVVAVTPNVAADTYPQVFYPPQPVQYVLEVNEGFAAKNNLIVGEQLSL